MKKASVYSKTDIEKKLVDDLGARLDRLEDRIELNRRASVRNWQQTRDVSEQISSLKGEREKLLERAEKTRSDMLARPKRAESPTLQRAPEKAKGAMQQDEIRVGEFVIIARPIKGHSEVKVGDNGVICDIYGSEPHQVFTVDVITRNTEVVVLRESLMSLTAEADGAQRALQSPEPGKKTARLR